MFGRTGSSLLHAGFLELQRGGYSWWCCMLLTLVASLVAGHRLQAHRLRRVGAQA